MIEDHGIVLVRKAHAEGRLTFHDGPLPYFSFPDLDRAGLLNGFTTRLGGVSTGPYASLGLSPKLEPPEIVQENYRRIGETLGFDAERAVLTAQTHSANIRMATEEDAGKGPFYARDYDQVDGLFTDVPDLPLVGVSADCPLVLLYDPVNRVCGIAHSGWKGTVQRIAEKLLQAMHEACDTRPEQVYAAVAPSICGDCYEVGEEVADAFREAFGVFRTGFFTRPSANEGKYLLDLWEANRSVLVAAGVPKDRIRLPDVCTKCNPGLFYSHRVSGFERSLQGAFLMIRKPGAADPAS